MYRGLDAVRRYGKKATSFLNMDFLKKNIIQGKVDGRRRPEKIRIFWLANLQKWFGATSTELLRFTAN